MLIRKTRPWNLPEAEVTPEGVYLDRRRLLKAMAAVPLLAGAGTGLATALRPGPAWAADPSAKLYPVARNMRYEHSREVTPASYATQYNNFYEFGSHKRIYRAAEALEIRPWTVAIDGLVEKPFEIGIDELLSRMTLEERVYRHRCVEAWSMVVPWSGFPFRDLVALARPLGSARYVAMQTFHDPAIAPGQREPWYPWPYTEGLTMAEATNELAFLVTGLYGKPVPKQNGAPLRLAVPWKYGFKSIKSIVRFTFTDKRPVSMWQAIQPKEYGFWANVNPEVAHPRWSQATERVLGTDRRVPTQLYNGYGAFVAELYKGVEGEALFR